MMMMIVVKLVVFFSDSDFSELPRRVNYECGIFVISRKMSNGLLQPLNAANPSGNEVNVNSPAELHCVCRLLCTFSASETHAISMPSLSSSFPFHRFAIIPGLPFLFYASRRQMACLA
jgi:hypothetical protein